MGIEQGFIIYLYYAEKWKKQHYYLIFIRSMCHTVNLFQHLLKNHV